jgi:putative spermidine/putrescine transport system permease protein
VANLFQPSILAAFWISIRISFASAVLGCAVGFAVAAPSRSAGCRGRCEGR